MDQLSIAYGTIQLSSFYKLVPFFPPHALEKLIVELATKKMVDLRIDHLNGIIIFKSNSMESYQFKNKLNELALGVNKAISMILPIYKPASVVKEELLISERKKKIFSKLLCKI